MPEPSALEVMAAAQRVAAEYQRRDSRATCARREWESKPTVSNAIRRDDTAKDRDEYEDANLLAEGILEFLRVR